MVLGSGTYLGADVVKFSRAVAFGLTLSGWPDGLTCRSGPAPGVGLHRFGGGEIRVGIHPRSTEYARARKKHILISAPGRIVR